ncbi:hypothetical protein [Parashewanella tropica]|uniref:hypothetical protein n=1 Tax=Parashewanella tropica TaxID=2547970 RepID=UPI001059C569|nr:hypothetical protein [Parashewanella tropica]
MKGYNKILWIDGFSAAIAGTLTLILHQFLVTIYGLPKSIILLIAIVNLIYAIYALFLAQNKTRSLLAVTTLVMGNSLWAICCMLIVKTHFTDMTNIGLLVIIAESIYVTGLAFFEWKWRHKLTKHLT